MCGSFESLVRIAGRKVSGRFFIFVVTIEYLHSPLLTRLVSPYLLLFVPLYLLLPLLSASKPDLDWLTIINLVVENGGWVMVN
jgi:hypothetical protein